MIQSIVYENNTVIKNRHVRISEGCRPPTMFVFVCYRDLLLNEHIILKAHHSSDMLYDVIAKG